MSAIHTHTLVRSERARCRVRMHVTHTHTHTHTNAQVQMSGLLPHAFLLGIEIHRASIATAVAALAAAGRRNVRVCRGDLTLLLRQVLACVCVHTHGRVRAAARGQAKTCGRTQPNHRHGA